MSFKQRLRRLTAEYWFPIVVAVIIAPSLIDSLSGGGKKNEVVNAELLVDFIQLCSYAVLCWPILFSYDAMSSKGNELLYIKNRNKLGYYILSLVIYWACFIPTFITIHENFGIINVWCEFVRFMIGGMFLVSMFYMLNYVSGNYILATVVTVMYSAVCLLSSVKNIEGIILYDGLATPKLLKDYYLVYLVLSVVMFAVGFFFNKEREKYLK